MYTESSINDGILFVKAFLSNQLAKLVPKLYVKLTHQTGRGSDESDISQIADYFIKCFHDYQDQLDLDNVGFRKYLKGKVVMEYGPGDILGMALLFYAHGAERVTCIDRFPLSTLSLKNKNVYVHLLNSLNNDERVRAENAFKIKGKPESGFNENIINYKVTKNGLSGEVGKYDLIISRAVLEHVNNLEETMLDIKKCMKHEGVSIHQVDLKSHGLDRYIEYDFLTWPNILYKLMYSHKGFPNRWRVDKYKEISKKINLKIKKLYSTGMLEQEKVKIIYPKLAKDFREISLEELSYQGFWVHFEL